MEGQELIKGDDVMYSEKGLLALRPHRKNRIATVKGFSVTGERVYIRWFGTVTNLLIHRSYITKI